MRVHKSTQLVLYCLANAHTSGTLYIVLLNNESTQKYTACIVLFSQCSYIRYIVYSLIE